MKIKSKKQKIFIISSISLAIAAILPVAIVVPVLTVNSIKNNNNSSNGNGSGNGNANSGNVDNIDNVQYQHSADPIYGKESFVKYDSSTKLLSSVSTQSPTHPSSGIQENALSSHSKLFDEMDIKQSKRTFSLMFMSTNSNRAMGTGWILDYKIPENKDEYPTTWYIATNAHVIQNLKVKDDKITPERYESDNFYNTNLVRFITIADPKTDTDYGNTKDQGNLYKSVSVDAIAKDGTPNFKTVFIGNDFLKTSPKQYFSNITEGEEYADFAVMEVKFPDADTAKYITSDYASDTTNQFKYKKESLLVDKSYKDKHSFRVMGYPALNTVEFDSKNYYSTPYLNKPAESVNINNTLKERSLANTSSYNTFNGFSGAFDANISLSFLGYNYRLNHNNPSQIESTEHYYSWGLGYAVNYAGFDPGSSGSMLMDDDGYTWGIHFGADSKAVVGLSQALYCEGFSYNNKLGNYNLAGYDLIEGGFPLQSKSYKDGLKTLYGNSFKTNLFPNGLN